MDEQSYIYRWQNEAIRRALRLLPHGYITKCLRERALRTADDISPRLQALIQERLDK